MCLVGICLPSLDSNISSLDRFSKWVIYLLFMSCSSSLYILDAISLEDMWFAKMSSYSVSCPFIFLMVSPWSTTFGWCSVHFFVCCWWFDIISKKPLLNPKWLSLSFWKITFITVWLPWEFFCLVSL